MRSSLLLDSVAYDTLPASAPALQFFVDRTDGVRAAAELKHEKNLVRWLLADLLVGPLIRRVLKISQRSLHALEVRSPFRSVGDKPGDIDVILCDEVQPHHSISLECKLVKATTTQDGRSDPITKLEAFGRSFEQANPLADVGFNRTFLTAIAVVDGTDNTSRNFLHRGMSATGLRRFLDVAEAIPLSPGIGILYVEVVEPLQAPLTTSGMVSAGVLRPATPREQREFFTATVLRYMRENGNTVESGS